MSQNEILLLLVCILFYLKHIGKLILIICARNLEMMSVFDCIRKIHIYSLIIIRKCFARQHIIIECIYLGNFLGFGHIVLHNGVSVKSLAYIYIKCDGLGGKYKCSRNLCEKRAIWWYICA